MIMRKYILFAFVWACVLSACSEKGIMEYSDNTLYVYFAADATKEVQLIHLKLILVERFT